MAAFSSHSIQNQWFSRWIVATLGLFWLIDNLAVVPAFTAAPLSFNTKRNIQRRLTLRRAAASEKTSKNKKKQASFETFASENKDPVQAVEELLVNWNNQEDQHPDIAFLFVGQYHADSFAEIVALVNEKLSSTSVNNGNDTGTGNHETREENDVNILAVLGGGVIGGGAEFDSVQLPCLTLMTGVLPEESYADIFSLDAGKGEQLASVVTSHSNSNNNIDKNNSGRPPSYIVFADPFSPLEELLNKLDEPRQRDPKNPPAVVAGGISVPKQMNQASLALNGKVLEAGSFVGVTFTGNVGLLAVVAQGCRPVGPTFVITQASGTILTGLSGETAISQLEDVANNADEQDQELIRNGELVCGIGSKHNHDSYYTTKRSSGEGDEENGGGGGVPVEDDFLIRQIMGFQPKSGSIVVAAGGLQEGNTFRFHVRAAQSAKEDMDLMIQRAKTERLFAGSSHLTKGPGSVSVSAGKPIAALQISCVARGLRFFGSPNVDLNKVETLFVEGSGDRQETPSSSPPIAGFFANGEIGPVGIRMAEMVQKDRPEEDRDASNTFLHGFTTVVAMLCDYSETESSTPKEELSADAIISTMDDAWA